MDVDFDDKMWHAALVISSEYNRATPTHPNVYLYHPFRSYSIRSDFTVGRVQLDVKLAADVLIANSAVGSNNEVPVIIHEYDNLRRNSSLINIFLFRIKPFVTKVVYIFVACTLSKFRGIKSPYSICIISDANL